MTKEEILILLDDAIMQTDVFVEEMPEELYEMLITNDKTFAAHVVKQACSLQLAALLLNFNSLLEERMNSQQEENF